MSKQDSNYANSLAKKVIAESTLSEEEPMDQNNDDNETQEVEQFDQEEFNDTLKQSIDTILAELPDDLRAYAAQHGDKDDKLELKINQETVNEAIGTAAVGAAASMPAVVKMMGKLSSKLGEKLDSNLLKKTGKAVSQFGKKWHDAYEKSIYNFLRNIVPKEFSDEQVKKAANALFLSIVAGLGVASGAGAFDLATQGKAGFAGVEGALSAVKSSEVLPIVRNNLTKILRSYFV